MRKILFLFIVTLFLWPVYGQKNIDGLIQQGIEYHDAGQYDKAIDMYEQALAVDAKSPLANYEMALTLMEIKNYNDAIKYCNRLLKRKDEFSVLAYNTKGACLNYMGRPDEAIEVFYEAIDKYPDHYLLHYNLGLAYHSKGSLYEAQLAYTDAIRLNPDHSGSHLNLGRVMENVSKHNESILCLFYFLLIEPNTERSMAAQILLRQQLGILGEGEAKLETDLKHAAPFREKVQRFLDTLDSSSGNSQLKGIWNELYLPFFISLDRAGYSELFSYYITYAYDQSAYEWLRNHPVKVDGFEVWLQEQED